MALESNLIAALIGGGLAISGIVVAQVVTLVSVVFSAAMIEM
jgi:hypothetical protein